MKQILVSLITLFSGITQAQHSALKTIVRPPTEVIFFPSDFLNVELIDKGGQFQVNLTTFANNCGAAPLSLAKWLTFDHAVQFVNDFRSIRNLPGSVKTTDTFQAVLIAHQMASCRIQRTETFSVLAPHLADLSGSKVTFQNEAASTRDCEILLSNFK